MPSPKAPRSRSRNRRAIAGADRESVPEGTQLQFVKVFLQERLWKSTKKLTEGKSLIWSGLRPRADISAASVAK
jgi:hypothetical protein